MIDNLITSSLPSPEPYSALSQPQQGATLCKNKYARSGTGGINLEDGSLRPTFRLTGVKVDANDVCQVIT